MKAEDFILIGSSIIGFLAGCLNLNNEVKSAAVKTLAIQTVEANQTQNHAIAEESKMHSKIKNIIKAKNAHTFSGAWNVISNKQRFHSICISSAASIGLGCLLNKATNLEYFDLRSSRTP